MPKLLKIDPPVEARFPGFDLRDLVALIPMEGAQLAWCVSPMGEGLEISGDLSPLETDALDLMHRMDTSVSGVPLSWAELVQLSEAIETLWGAFLGGRDTATLAELPPEFHGWWRYLDRLDGRFYERVEIAFQAVDSSYWLVYARNDAVGERIAGAFENVEILNAAV